MKKFLILLFIVFNAFSQSSAQNKFKGKYARCKQISENHFLVYSNNKSGVADSLGKEVIPLLYDRLEYENGLLIAEQNGRKGLLLLDNSIVTPIQYEWILPRENNRFLIIHNNLSGVIDNQNNFIIPLQYENIKSYLNDFFIVRNQKGLNGIYNYKGEIVLPEQYVFYNIDNNKIFCTENNRCLILDFADRSKTVYLSHNIKFKQQSINHTMRELFNQIFITDGKQGLMDSNNQILIPAVYDDLANLFDASLFVAKLNNKYGLISFKNNIIKEIIYDVIDVKKEYIVLKRKGHEEEYYSIATQQTLPASKKQ